MNNRDMGKGGKTAFGGGVKNGAACFHGSKAKGYADGGRVRRMADGGDPDPFGRKDEAFAEKAMKDREDYEWKQRDARVDEPAEAPMKTTTSETSDAERASTPKAAEMDARQSEPASDPIKPVPVTALKIAGKAAGETMARRAAVAGGEMLAKAGTHFRGSKGPVKGYAVATKNLKGGPRETDAVYSAGSKPPEGEGFFTKLGKKLGFADGGVAKVGKAKNVTNRAKKIGK
jgi:hypothetical protein